MTTTDSWIRFARLALQIGRDVLLTYAHKFSPRCFTLPQLAACVLLKEYRQADWRSFKALLAVCPPLA